MSTPATPEFLLAWSGVDQREPFVLLKIVLATPSAQTIYLSNGEDIVTPDGQAWQGGLLADIEPFDFPGDLLASSWEPATGSFTLVNDAFAFQAAGKKVADAFIDFDWEGAAVTLYLWERSLASFTKALAFTGFLVQKYDPTRWLITVHVAQDWRWNRVPLKTVNRKNFPRAPDETIGFPIPTIRGRILTPDMRPPWTAKHSTDSWKRDYSTGGVRALGGILVDVGSGGAGGTPSKVIFASHKCKTIWLPAGGGNGETGCLFFLQMDDKLSILEPTDTFNDDWPTGAGFKVPDDAAVGEPYNTTWAFVFYAIPNSNVEIIGGGVDAFNPRAAMDIANETSFARLDTTKTKLRMRLTNPATAGELVGIRINVGYRTNTAAADPVMTSKLRDSVGSVTQVGPNNINKSATPTVVRFAQAITFDPWDFGDKYIEVEYTAASGTADIFFVACDVKIRPTREIVAHTDAVYEKGFVKHARKIPEIETWMVSPPFDLLTWKNDKFYATIEGYADDGSGTYTGVANVVVERPCDIARHLMVIDGGLASGDFETGAPAFGSFVDARAELKTWRFNDMVSALVMNDLHERLSEALARLCEDAAIWVIKSEFGSKFQCHVWKAGKAVNFDRPITRYDWADLPKLSPIAGSRRQTSVRVDYAFDEWKGVDTQSTDVSHSHSAAGRGYIGIRDQQLTVVASGAEQNNKIDYKTGGTDYHATLTTGRYAGGWEASQDAKTAMNTAHASDWVGGFGPRIVAGVNDTIPAWNIVSGYTPATIAASAYATMEDLAAAVQTALVAADGTGGWSASYSRSTHKIAIATNQVVNPRELRWSAGSVANKRAMAVLGYKLADFVGPGTSTADYEREEDRIHLGNLSVTFDLKWMSGTNGADGTNTHAASMLGYDPAQDLLSTGATDGSFMGYSPVGTREQTAVDTGEAVGQKPPSITVNRRTIYDDDTAREVRNRLADLQLPRRPPLEVTLLSHPDLERGRVFQFHSSADEATKYAVYGSDGLWSTKKFMCVSKRQHFAGRFATEVTAVEVS